MANVTVNIPSPILQGSEKFKVRYRLLPSGAFGAYADKFTNSFVLSGLSDGKYEIEVIFVTEDGTECDPVYYQFEVVPEFTCWDFVAIQEEYPANSGLYRIRMTFSGGTQPPCGWQISLTPLGGSASVYTYPTLPASNTVNIAIPNNVIYTITVTALLCGGKDKQCYSVNTTPVPTPPTCTGAVINDLQLLHDPVMGTWHLFIDFAQSNPPTLNANITYQQSGVPRTTGQIMDSGSFVQTGYLFGGTLSNSTIYIRVNPTVPMSFYVYDVRFLDRCGNWLTAQVVFG